jgi:AcrR family transcriptional regulator
VGRTALIDRRVVLDVGFELAEDGGLPAVTMHAVAKRLGVTPMALYRHVQDKADLLDGVVERLLLEVELPDERLPWEQRLGDLVAVARTTARRHPEVFPLLLQRPATTPAARRIREAVYSALRDAGVSDEDVPRAERLLSTLVLGLATSEASGRFDDVETELAADYAFLRAVLDELVAARAKPPARAPRKRAAGASTVTSASST